MNTQYQYITRVSDYEVVSGANGADLAGKVKLLVSQGWEPQGGIAAASGFLYQALIKGNVTAVATSQTTQPDNYNKGAANRF